jgi:hypothetical protein
MSLESSYEVLEMLRDDGIQTFRAREKATGRGLELHLFPPFGRPENKVLFEKLKALPLETRRKFLDLGVDGSTPYVVTDPLPGARGLRSWADEWINGSPEGPQKFAPVVSPVLPPEPPSKDDGVKILQAGQWRTGTPIPESLVSRPPGAPPPPPAGMGDYTVVFKAPVFTTPEPKKAEAGLADAGKNDLDKTTTLQPGEFTGLFQAADLTRPPLMRTPQELPPPVGEFTGMFQAGQASPPPLSPPIPLPTSVPIAPQQDAGEFTRMFQNPLHPVQPASRREPESSGGGEFTKFFENPLKPAPLSAPRPMTEAPPPTPPLPEAKRGGDFTKVFGNPINPAAGGFSFDAPPATPQSPQGGAFGAVPSATGQFSGQGPWSQPQTQPAFAAGPSEYTKMMGAPAIPTLGQVPSGQAPGPAPTAAPVAKKSNTPLYVALGVVIALLIALVVFLLVHQSAAVTTPAAK